MRLVRLYGDHCGALDGGASSQLHLANLLPSLGRRSEGQQTLEKLALMTAAELERFLVGPPCDARFRALLENYLLVARAAKSPSHRGILRSRSAAPGLGSVRRNESSTTLVAGPLSELLCLPLTVGRAETPQEKGRAPNRRVVMMKRTPAESLMAAAVEAREVESESVTNVERKEVAETKEVQVVKSRPQSGRSRASSRPLSGRAMSNSRPPSRSGRLSRPGSAVKTEELKAVAQGPQVLALPLSNHKDPKDPKDSEQDALTSFVSHMERERIDTKVSLSPSPSRRRLERTPTSAASLPKGDDLVSSPYAKSRIKLFQLVNCDIEL